MINYYKYLPVSEEDERWGLCVLNTGCTHVEALGAYPSKTHPSHHNFSWRNGRTLNEYQVIYITKGKGLFESEHCNLQEVKAGTLIFLFPGERHRYKPDDHTGWDEYWIGVKGEVLDNLVKRSFFKPEVPCQYIGFNENIFCLFNTIIENTKQELPGYQQLISGAALHLMGNCHAITRQNSFCSEEKEIIVNRARLLFRENITAPFSPEQAAKQLNIGYSRFRKIFKSYTGLSPGQYYIQLKIEQAKSLLHDRHLSVKEIAFKLNFESYFYFAKLFREKTGLSPTDFRKQSGE
ncbi:MAG: helix-turn-helix domain-containing protein [Mucilaginibacter sp.]